MKDNIYGSFNATPERTGLVTNIICSFVRSHTIFTDACKLISFPQTEKNSHISQRRFVYMDAVFADIVKKRLEERVPFALAKSVLGSMDKESCILVNREENAAASIFRLVTSSFFLACPIPNREPDSLVLSIVPDTETVSLQQFRKISTSKASTEQNSMRFATIVGDSISVMSTAFAIFATDRLTDVTRVRWQHGNRDTVLRENQELPHKAMAAAESSILGMRDLLHSHDDGTMPETVVDETVVRNIVHAESTVEYVPSCTRYLESVKSKIKLLLQHEQFLHNYSRMEEKYRVGDFPRFMANIGLPTLYYELPALRPKIANHAYDARIDVQRNDNGSIISRSSWKTVTPSYIQYDEPCWDSYQQTDVVKYGFSFSGAPMLHAILSLSEILRFAETPVLQKVCEQMSDLEHSTEYIYHFMNATRNLFATDILLANV